MYRIGTPNRSNPQIGHLAFDRRTVIFWTLWEFHGLDTPKWSISDAHGQKGKRALNGHLGGETRRKWGHLHGLGAEMGSNLTPLDPRFDLFWTYLGPRIDLFWTPFGDHIQVLATSGVSAQDGAARPGLKAPSRGHSPPRPSRDGWGGGLRKQDTMGFESVQNRVPFQVPAPKFGGLDLQI